MDIVHCVLVVPLLPGHALEDVRSEIDADTLYSAQLQQLAARVRQTAVAR